MYAYRIIRVQLYIIADIPTACLRRIKKLFFDVRYSKKNLYSQNTIKRK